MLFNEMNNNLELILRLIIAGFFGAIIGYERTSKHKEAGLKTHVIVAISSALMMLISKYAFYDVKQFDGARVAAQIVSGVGFLGAGIIFVRDKITVSGLTTAAGIWGTAGVGMAVGSGLYLLGFVSSLLMVLSNTFLKNTFANLKEQKTIIIEIIFDESDEKTDFDIEHFLEFNHFKLVSINTYNYEKKKKIELISNYFIEDFNNNKISSQLKEMKNVISYRCNFIT